jgi:hypothetical protein
MQNPLPGMQSFIFGGNTGMTVQSLKKRREIADLLAAQATGGTPRNTGEGINAIGKALASRFIDKRIGGQEEAAHQSVADILAGLGGGGYTPSYSGPVGGAPGGFTGVGVPPQGQPVAPAMGQGNAPAGYEERLGQIESGWDGQAQNPNSSAGGYFQWTDGTANQYGVEKGNLASERAGLARFNADNAKVLAPVLGRAPNPSEFYLAHQQGAGGAAKLLSNPDAPAVSVVGQDAVVNNGGDPNMSAGQFAQHVMSFYDDGAGGGAMPGMEGMMGGGEPDMGKLQQLAEVLSNPYADEGQKTIAELLIKREMDAGGGGMTPYQAAQLGMDSQRLQLDRDKFAAGTREGVQSFGAINYAQRDDPNTPEVDPKMSPYVTDKAGQVKWLDLGGAEARPPVQWQDTGTEKVPVYSAGGGAAGEPLAVDVAGKAAQGVTGEVTGQAKAGLPDFTLQVGQASALIDKIVADPALGNAAGVINSKLPTIHQDTANVEADVEQLKSEVFPMAIQALKGLGAMSNMEGDAFAKSVASLDLRRDPQAVIAELNRLKGVLASKLAIAQQKAAGNMTPASPAAAPQRLRYNPATGDFE